MCALILQVGREGIVVCTVQHKVILRGAVSVDAENALGTLLERRARLIHACGEKRQLVVATSVERQVAYLLRIYNVTHVGRLRI